MGMFSRVIGAILAEDVAPPTTRDIKSNTGAEETAPQTAYETASAKGTEFEKYVIKRFSAKWYALHDWTRDTADKTTGRRVESNGNPDLVMRHKPTGDLIAIECKFRSRLYKGALTWSKPQQLERYNEYMNTAGIPVYVVIGLGGSPSHPDQMFCIPLGEAKYPKLYSGIYAKYARAPTKGFFWDGKVLK